MRVGRKFGAWRSVARCAFGAQWCLARHAKFSKAQHGVAWRVWQRNGTAKQAQQIQCGKCLRAKQRTANSAWQVWRNGQCLRAKQAKRNGAVFGRGTSLSLSLSLVARTFWHAFGLNLKGFFTHFVVVSSHLVVNFSYFIAVFPHIFAVTFRFIIVLTHLFACKRHFLGHYAFLKFLNALFLGFCALFVILSLCKKAKNPHKLKDNLPFLDTSLALSMTNSGFCLKTTDKENALCHLKMTADFVILSAATQRVARRKPQQKNPKNLRYALFLDTSLALSMTKRVFGMTRQIGMINLGCRLNFLKRKKNLKNSKNLKKRKFFKNFLLEVQKRHYVSRGCVTMRLFK